VLEAGRRMKSISPDCGTAMPRWRAFLHEAGHASRVRTRMSIRRCRRQLEALGIPGAFAYAESNIPPDADLVVIERAVARKPEVEIGPDRVCPCRACPR